MAEAHSPAEIKVRLNAAVEMALEAGQITLRYFQHGNFAVERKSDRSPVTIADREAEKFLRQRIAQLFPQDAIVGEELGEAPGQSGYRWILDPIDGTKSFIYGVPLYGTMIGVEFDRQAVVGAVNVAGLGECVYAAVGEGCWHVRGNAAPTRARVSEASLNEGLFVTSQIDSFAQRGAAEVFHAVEDKAYVTRTWGDCYGYILVATGRAVVMLDPQMNVWDAAAVQPIVEEAGGSFTDWKGQRTIHGGEAIGANGNRQMLSELLEVTRRFPKAP